MQETDHARGMEHRTCKGAVGPPYRGEGVAPEGSDNLRHLHCQLFGLKNGAGGSCMSNPEHRPAQPQSQHRTVRRQYEVFRTATKSRARHTGIPSRRRRAEQGRTPPLSRRPEPLPPCLCPHHPTPSTSSPRPSFPCQEKGRFHPLPKGPSKIGKGVHETSTTAAAKRILCPGRSMPWLRRSVPHARGSQCGRCRSW